MSQPPYRTLPVTAFWSTAVREPVDSRTPLAVGALLEELDEEEAVVVSCGSCFAQYIGRELLSRNRAYLQSTLSDGRVESLGTGNIYSIAQLRQWLEFATDARSWADNTVFEAQGQHFDYLLPHREPTASRADLIAHRKLVANETLRHLCDANVLIFTIGLTETWRNDVDDVFPVCPGTLVGEFDATAHRFVNCSFEDVIADLEAVERLLESINSSLRLVLTVSPVPLTATASDEHVLVASTYSKSVIRAAIGQFCSARERVTYFPSYELINHPRQSDWRFEKNLRSVSKAGVGYVMNHAFGDDELVPSVAAVEEPSKNTVNNDSTSATVNYTTDPMNVETGLQNDPEALCEEEMLDAYARSGMAPKQDAELFLIGDSHMQKLMNGLEEIGLATVGGQVMNGSGFSDHKFELSNKTIFTPLENDKSREIWNALFDRLNALNAPCNVITNVGFQTHRTINQLCNHYDTPVATDEQIADYFREYYSQHLDILRELKQFGTVWLVEDPNFYAFINQKDVSTMIRDKNFHGYCLQLRAAVNELGIQYLAPCDLAMHRYFGKVGNIKDLVAPDGFHGTPLYYRSSAEVVHEAITRHNESDAERQRESDAELSLRIAV